MGGVGLPGHKMKLNQLGWVSIVAAKSQHMLSLLSKKTFLKWNQHHLSLSPTILSTWRNTGMTGLCLNCLFQ